MTTNTPPPPRKFYLDYSMTPSDGIARCGEPVRLNFRLMDDGQPATGVTLHCITKWEARECARRDFAVSDGNEEMVVEHCSARPGWVYFAFQLLDASGELIRFPGSQIKQFTKKEEFLYEIGAIYEPEHIVAIPSCPPDFDAFWDGELQRLKALPMAAQMTPVEPPGEYAGKVKAFSLEVNCLGSYPVTGYVAWPEDAQPHELPACLDLLSHVLQDVPLKSTCQEAADNHALQMYLSWHGQPTGHPESWYVNHKNDYYHPYQDIDDPQKWSMHEMFLRALRGLHYLKTLPQWNRHELVVRGGSLAGIEAIALAALDEDIDVALINVPTGCELNALQSGRNPTWVFRITGRAELLDNPAVAHAVAYHDGVNFAPRIKCETYVCTGLADEICFPSNVCAFYNAMTNASSKRLTISPASGHYGTTVNTAGDSRLARLFKRVIVSENRH